MLPQVTGQLAISRSFLDLLVDLNILHKDVVGVLAEKTLTEIEQYLLGKRIVDNTHLKSIYSQFFALPIIDLDKIFIEKEVSRLLPEDVARKFDIVPYRLKNFELSIAVAKPSVLQIDAPRILAALHKKSGIKINLAIAVSPDQVKRKIDIIYSKPKERDEPPKEVTKPIETSKPVEAPKPAENDKVFDKSATYGGETMPAKGEALPAKGEITPAKGEAVPARGEITPAKGEAVPARGEAVQDEKNKSDEHRLFLNKTTAIEHDEPRKVKEADLSKVIIPKRFLAKIPKEVALKYKIVCFGSNESHTSLEPSYIKIGAVNPGDPQVAQILGFIEQKNSILVERYKISQEAYDAVLKQYEAPAPVQPIQPQNKPEQKPEKEEHEEQRIEINHDLPPIKHIEEKKEERDEPASSAFGRDKSASKRDETKNEDEDIYVETKLNQAKAGLLKPQEKIPEQVPHAPEMPDREPLITPINSDQGALELSDKDIVNQPTGGTSDNAEMQKLMAEQDAMLQEQDLDKLIRRPVNNVADLAAIYKGGFIPEIVAATMLLAIKMQASDIHIEAQQKAVRIRYRVDGILHDVLKVPKFLHPPLISRIKILTKMKIDEQRVPQDGRFDVVIDKRQVDVRVSSLPTVHGEKIVMRLLDKSAGIMNLEQLGVTGSNFDLLVKNIDKPYGIILSTGPTGSGKSTTLYAVLNRISKPGINIITLEDPVEYELTGINQVQVKPQIGFSFAEGLRSVLRQDPNVIMVGEIRDLETAALATHAALTGHLVLSTLHTNDAAGALPRLINMGVEPFLITSSINAVVGQRLVRKICDNCRAKTGLPTPVLNFVKQQLASIPSGQLKSVISEDMTFYHGTGCENCNGGYKGRIGIYEVLAMNDEIENLSINKKPSSEIKQAAVKAGMITMTQDGLLKALKGITTIDEVLRVTTTNIKELPGG